MCTFEAESGRKKDKKESELKGKWIVCMQLAVLTPDCFSWASGIILEGF